MTDFDYRSAIESAKTILGYRENFAAFKMKRGNDSISVCPADPTVRTSHYDFKVDTTALNKELNSLRASVIRTLPHEADGFDDDGFDDDGFDDDGFDDDGFDDDGFDKHGFSRDGLDVDGFSREAIAQDGFFCDDPS